MTWNDGVSCKRVCTIESIPQTKKNRRLRSGWRYGVTLISHSLSFCYVEGCPCGAVYPPPSARPFFKGLHNSHVKTLTLRKVAFPISSFRAKREIFVIRGSVVDVWSPKNEKPAISWTLNLEPWTLNFSISILEDAPRFLCLSLICIVRSMSKRK